MYTKYLLTESEALTEIICLRFSYRLNDEGASLVQMNRINFFFKYNSLQSRAFSAVNITCLGYLGSFFHKMFVLVPPLSHHLILRPCRRNTFRQIPDRSRRISLLGACPMGLWSATYTPCYVGTCWDTVGSWKYHVNLSMFLRKSLIKENQFRLQRPVTLIHLQNKTARTDLWAINLRRPFAPVHQKCIRIWKVQ